MEIKMSKMEYQFDNEGNTAGINAGYSNYDGGESFSCIAVITDTADKLDGMSKKDVDLAARTEFAKWLGTDAIKAALAILEPVEETVSGKAEVAAESAK